ncbi:MAG: FeS assembly SUF system regulator [Candidatus Krumholzibacteriia bacterium]|jgi:FeS assembly SUF system regulator
MTCLARRTDREAVPARDLAAEMGLPMPTVSKVLKLLSGSQLLNSTRGASGGYCLARPAAEISLAEMFEVLEGPLSMTECTDNSGCDCNLEQACGLKPNWNWINQKLLGTLQSISLQNMAGSVAAEMQGTVLHNLVEPNRTEVST